MIGGGAKPVTTERNGRPFRHFPVAVSAGAMALAWSRQESAPHMSAVLVDHEINALGRLGAEWTAGATNTLSAAVVLRPPLDAESADVGWLIGGLGVSQGIDALTGGSSLTLWPDVVLAGDDERLLAALFCEAQLAPGRVRSIIVTFRIDMKAVGVDAEGRDALLDSVLDAIAAVCEGMEEGAEGAAAGYQSRCILVDRKIVVRMRPTGETRGIVAGVDSHARLQIRSTTGMVERITIDMLRDLNQA